MKAKQNNRLKIKARIRSKVNGSQESPRLTVFKSNKEIYAQLIDDNVGKTILSCSTKELKLSVTKTDASKEVGKSIAEKAKSNGISKVVFDRNGYLYHGRVKALADGAREGGLEF